MKKWYFQSGFSLIELLVAASIIAILSAIGLANFRTAAQKARDSRRIGDLEQIRGALELYRADANQYPGSLPGCQSDLSYTVGAQTNTYMKSIPCDPRDNVTPYGYERVDSSNYYLGSKLEISGTYSPVDCNLDTSTLNSMDYCISNP